MNFAKMKALPGYIPYRALAMRAPGPITNATMCATNPTGRDSASSWRPCIQSNADLHGCSPDGLRSFDPRDQPDMMMKTLQRYPLAGLWLLLLAAGCYTSPVPIAPLDEAPRVVGISGEWLEVDTSQDPGEAPTHVTIATSDDVLFSIVAASSDPTQTDTLRFEGFATRLGEDVFGNLKVVGEKIDQYLLIRFVVLDPDSVRVELVSDALMTQNPATSDALRMFLLSHAGNPELFEEEVTYFVRVK